MSGLVAEDIDVALGEGRSLVVSRLQVADGEHLVLFGPNGAGKSTLLRLIAGTLEGGPAIPSAYLPQRPILFRGKAGWNLRLGLGPEDANRSIELAHDFGIKDVLDRSARTLSGGERQRLVLARTLARPEQVVLLDEPLAALDARDRGSVAATIKRELRGRTAIVVTHDREEAAMLGRRMAVLVDGRILQIGALEEVFSLPTDDRVAAAVGIANVLRGEVIQTEGALSAIRSGPVEVWGVGDVAPGTKATAMFGAEAVTVFAGSEPTSGSARNTFSGTVMEVRSAGRLVELVVDCGIPIAALVTPGSLEALGVAARTDVVLTLKATAVRVVAT